MHKILDPDPDSGVSYNYKSSEWTNYMYTIIIKENFEIIHSYKTMQ